MRNLESILSQHKPKKKTSKSLYLYSLSYFTRGRTKQAILNDYAAELGMKKPTRSNFEFHLNDVPEPNKEKPDPENLPGLAEVIAAKAYLENISEHAKKAIPQACDMGDLKAIIALDTLYQDKINSDFPPEIQLIRLAKEGYKKDQERIREESKTKDNKAKEDRRQKELRKDNQKRIDEINKEETLEEEMHKHHRTGLNRSDTLNNRTTSYKRIINGITIGAISLIIGIGAFYAPSYVYNLTQKSTPQEEKAQQDPRARKQETAQKNKTQPRKEPDYDSLVSRATDYIKEGRYETAKDILERCMEGDPPQTVYDTIKIVNNRIEHANKVKGQLKDLFKQYDKALKEDVYTQIQYHKHSNKIIPQMDSFKFEGVSSLARKLSQYENRFESNIERIAEQKLNHYKRRMKKIEGMANDGSYKQAQKEYYKVKGRIEKEKQRGLFTKEYLGD